jgi:predicted metal-dependent phosphoesterase TrpH
MESKLTKRYRKKMMKVDLHVHCKERSACGRSSEEEQIVAAIGSGLDAIVFTDHNRLVSEQHIQKLNKKHTPFRVFGGIEVSVESEDIIVLGIHDPSVEAQEWTYRELHGFVRERGGFMALAHPFRYHDTINVDLETFRPDAIEIMSNNTPRIARERIHAVSSRLGIPVVCNSDSHERSVIGRYYNIINHFPENEMGMIRLLRSGEFRCNVSYE